jgi:hypothetical protein
VRVDRALAAQAQDRLDVVTLVVREVDLGRRALMRAVGDALVEFLDQFVEQGVDPFA